MALITLFRRLFDRSTASRRASFSGLIVRPSWAAERANSMLRRAISTARTVGRTPSTCSTRFLASASTEGSERRSGIGQ